MRDVELFLNDLFIYAEEQALMAYNFTKEEEKIILKILREQLDEAEFLIDDELEN